MTTKELVKGASSEELVGLLTADDALPEIKRAILALPFDSGRRMAKVQEFISVSLKNEIKAIWTLADVKRIAASYDLTECEWHEYIGYAPREVEQLVDKYNEFITTNGLRGTVNRDRPWQRPGSGAELMVLCDKKMVVRSVVDPFLCIRVNDVNCRALSFFMMHKWGPDVTSEREEIVERGKRNFIMRLFK